MKAWNFELRSTIEGVIVADRFTGTCSECHRKADELATRLGGAARTLPNWEPGVNRHPGTRTTRIGVFCQPSLAK